MEAVIGIRNVLTQGAFRHRKDLAVNDNLRFDGPLDDYSAALVDLERDAVGLRWILGKSAASGSDGKVTSAEKHEDSAEAGREPATDGLKRAGFSMEKMRL
ncbi:MAG: hypothetical protein R3F07_17970 [Opitutaceae bacterium]